MKLSLAEILKDIANQLVITTDVPELEAAWMVEQVAGLSRHQQRVAHSLTEGQAAALQQLVARRLAGAPLAYVLGEQHFWTLRLKVNEQVLIPRPETELVVERALQQLTTHTPARVLDLGTGSGAIALAVARERPTAQVVAVDVSAQAVAVAEANARLNQINNVTFTVSDWYSSVPLQPYALILSNPPYIAEGDPHLQAAVLQYEPRTALISGSDGLEALRHIVRRAREFLAPAGWLILEHGWQQATSVRQLLESAGLGSVASHADLAGHLRVTEAQAPNP